MQILFFMRQSASIGAFESTLRLLLEREHRIHLVLDRELMDRRGRPMRVVAGLAEQFPGLSRGPEPDRGTVGGSVFVEKLRLAIDYLRYLEPRYHGAPKLLGRAERGAPRLVRYLAGRPPIRTRLGLEVFRRVLRLVESAVPPSPEIDRFIREHRPDLVLVTPLVDLGSDQADYVRGARALGVRTVLCARGWDNLTSKGLLRDCPDVVAVWNDAMKREAVELHGVPASKIVVTGAPGFDHWFEGAPSTTPAKFRRRVGLPQDRPFLLYVCSSQLIAPAEVGFIERWIRRLRDEGDGRLRECGILVRPHPNNAAQWGGVDLSGLGGVAVWPRAGGSPMTARVRAGFYDSIYHSVAVVGINTSALIESAIVGRPVHTLLAPELRDAQEGTLHFRHLLHVNGGLLHVAETFEAHVAQLAEALASGGRADERNRRFLEGFVRPHGLGVPATPRLVEAIEAAGAGPAPALPPRQTALPEWLLAPLAAYAWWHYVRWRRQERPRERPEAGASRTSAQPSGYSRDGG